MKKTKSNSSIFVRKFNFVWQMELKRLTWHSRMRKKNTRNRWDSWWNSRRKLRRNVVCVTFGFVFRFYTAMCFPSCTTHKQHTNGNECVPVANTTVNVHVNGFQQNRLTRKHSIFGVGNHKRTKRRDCSVKWDFFPNKCDSIVPMHDFIGIKLDIVKKEGRKSGIGHVWLPSPLHPFCGQSFLQ